MLKERVSPWQWEEEEKSWKSRKNLSNTGGQRGEPPSRKRQGEK